MIIWVHDSHVWPDLPAHQPWQLKVFSKKKQAPLRKDLFLWSPKQHLLKLCWNHGLSDQGQWWKYKENETNKEAWPHIIELRWQIKKLLNRSLKKDENWISFDDDIIIQTFKKMSTQCHEDLRAYMFHHVLWC